MAYSSEGNTGKVLIAPTSIAYASSEAKETHLGEGGFGIVKKGVFDGKPVAVKKFIVDKNGDDDVMTKATFFLGEAKNMRQMHHPRIVKFLGFIMEEMAIVMEFMEYGNLEVYIAKNLDMKWSQRFIFMMDVAEGMDYLHSKVDADGKPKQVVFHQDLKSANILLGMEDGFLRGKISDFGFSIIKDRTQKTESSTLQSAVAHVGGTRIYMAPELFQTTMFTKECDVYSYGVILMELIAMLPPVDAVRDYKIKLVSLQKVPSTLTQLTEKCLDLIPKKRPLFTMVMKTLLESRLYIENCTAAAIKPPKEKPAKFDMSLYASSMFERSNNRTQFKASHTKGYYPDDSDSDVRRCCALFPSKREKRWVMILSVILLLLFIVGGIVVGILVSKPSSGNITVSSNNQTTSTPVPTLPVPVVDPIDWNKIPNMGGVNYPLMYALSEENQVNMLKELSRTNVKLIRIIIKKVDASSTLTRLPDVEPTTVGVYDDTILLAIDKLMANAYRYGMKVLIAFHDRYSLGCTDQDAYTLQYQLPSTLSLCTNDPQSFYKDSSIVQAYDNRIKYILAHRNAYFNQRPWKDLTDVIYAFDVQHQSQAKTSVFQVDWMCGRAAVVRSLIASDVRVATGGGGDMVESLRESYFTCNSVDIIGMTVMSTDYVEIFKGFSNASTLASNYSKTVVIEAFGAISGKSAHIKYVASFANKFSFPWVVWTLSLSSNASTYEFSNDDTTTWASLRKSASDALAGEKNIVYPPSMQKSDWDFCSINEECKNLCCSNIYSDDDKMKCTTGTTKCGYFKSDGLVKDWLTCTKSSECSAQCCSRQHSDKKQLKCTPGGNQCI